MKTKRTNWSTHETFGGTPLISRGSGKAFAATDHCVALVKTCPRCLEKFMATPTKQDHGCAPAEFAADPESKIGIRYVQQWDIVPDPNPLRMGDCVPLWTEEEIESAKVRGAERAKQYL